MAELSTCTFCPIYGSLLKNSHEPNQLDEPNFNSNGILLYINNHWRLLDTVLPRLEDLGFPSSHISTTPENRTT